MKYLFFLIIFIVFICCTSPYSHLTIKCTKPTEEIFNQIIEISKKVSAFYLVKKMSIDSGYLEIEKQDLLDISNGRKYTWDFQIDGNTIKAKAHYRNPVSGLWFMVDDGQPKSQKWYWDIRNELEKICEDKVIYIKK